MRNASTLFPTNGVSIGARNFMVRRFAEAVGALLIIGVILIGLALASWSTRDPSWNHATSGPIKNLLGFRGAILADLLTQIFGLAALALVAPIAYWGWRLLVDHALDRIRARLFFWILAVLFVATLASMAPPTDRWPLPCGLGGMIGDALAALPRRLFAATPLANLMVTLFMAGGALLSLAATCSHKRTSEIRPIAAPKKKQEKSIRIQRVEEDLEDEPNPAIISIGAMLHSILALRAGIGRKFTDAKGAFARRIARAENDCAEALSSQAAIARTNRAERIEPEFKAPPKKIAPIPADAPFARTKTQPKLEPAEEAPRPYDIDQPETDCHDGFDEANDCEDAPTISAGSAIQKLDVQSAPITVARVTAAAAPLKQTKKTNLESPLSGASSGVDAYDHPPLALLSEAKKGAGRRISEDALVQNARLLEGVLDDFGVKGEIMNVRPGPVVTLYELEPAPGIKSSRVIGLADDIARSMSAISARVAVVQGRNAIGVELPNHDRETVFLRELLASADFETSKHRLAIALGKTIGGEPVIVDLARMPHLLVAGTTGSGKSVAINTMILSLLYRLKPEQCRLIMVDPKMLELSVYDGIPHLLTPVVTDPKKAVVALKWAVREMEDRYKKMSKLGVRNIDGFNARVSEADSEGKTITRTVQTGFNKETGEAVYEEERMELSSLPYIVVIVDEMADLMMVAGKDIEGAIQRLAQMARAAGIHLIMATQRPSVDVITGTIKANFPTRISFQVTSKIDSRTILGEQGAEQLLGQGDMLYMAGGGRISRVHGPFVSDDEVEKVVAHLKTQGAPEYLESITAEDDEDGEDAVGSGGDTTSGGDENADLYDRAVAIVLRDRKCSTSYIQRRLSIGYNKAASLVERMEKQGVVGKANHAGKREILVGSPERDAMGRPALIDD